MHIYTGCLKSRWHISIVYNLKSEFSDVKVFFHITKVSIRCLFWTIFGKTLNLNFNGLTGSVNAALCVNSYVQFHVKK